MQLTRVRHCRGLLASHSASSDIQIIYFFSANVQSDTTVTGSDAATAVLMRNRLPSCVTSY